MQSKNPTFAGAGSWGRRLNGKGLGGGGWQGDPEGNTTWVEDRFAKVGGGSPSDRHCGKLCPRLRARIIWSRPVYWGFFHCWIEPLWRKNPTWETQSSKKKTTPSWQKMRIWHISPEKKTETGHQTKKAWIVRSRHHQSFTTKKAVGREEVYACILQKRFEKRNTPSTAGQAVWTAENFFHLSLECVSKKLGDTPRSQNLLHQAARRQSRFRQRLDLFHGSGCITMKVCLDAIGQCRARLGQRSTCFSRMMSPTLDHCSRLCNSSRIRSANCCISKDPSIWTFKSAVATRTAGRSGVQTPWSSSNPRNFDMFSWMDGSPFCNCHLPRSIVVDTFPTYKVISVADGT